jgi:hypothetical protein
MEKEKYDKCKYLINRIDTISNNMKTLSDSLTEYKSGNENRKAKLMIYAGGNCTETVLTDDEVQKVVDVVIETYSDIIEDYRQTLDNIVNSICFVNQVE